MKNYASKWMTTSDCFKSTSIFAEKLEEAIPNVFNHAEYRDDEKWLITDGVDGTGFMMIGYPNGVSLYWIPPNESEDYYFDIENYDEAIELIKQGFQTLIEKDVV